MALKMLRASITVLSVIALTTVFSLSIYAAPNVPFQTGTITVRGNVTVNGNAVQTGGTMMSGNTVTTGSDGNAVIDLGSAGRVELRDGTTATITFTGDSFQIQTSCRTEIEVTSGTVNVTSPTTETLNSGQDKTYDGGVNASATGGANIIVDCEPPSDGDGGAWIGPGLIGVLALIGVGAAVATGIALGDEDSVDVVGPSVIR